jgi:2-polyprenyl-3-methyl-5-hydroxy-6-metoxy-1,4-benzoquinol methylase
MKLNEKTYYRGWEYIKKGDYHKNLDPNWAYTPTYLKKMKYVRNFLNKLPKETKILDAGCGEGVLVEEYRLKGYLIEGLDVNYESEYVRRGDILDLPYSENTFDVVVCLDVLEHIDFKNQSLALENFWRVLKPSGRLVISIPNLAHFNSRVYFFLKGILDRTDVETNHIGERPIKENIKLLQNAGFEIISKKDITLTVPILYRRIICRKPAQYRWLHDILDLFAVPSLAMLNIFVCKIIK